MTRDEDRIAQLLRAINARDLDATVSCYAADARFVDPLESGMLEGLDAIRAHFIRLFETLRVELTAIDLTREPDRRLRARLHIVTRGPGGGLWQDDLITVWYRLDRGLIAEQHVDDNSRDRP